MDRGDALGTRFDELHAEATAALTYGANTVRAARDRYREAYVSELARWNRLRDELLALERHQAASVTAGPDEAADPATAAEHVADDARTSTLRADVDLLAAQLGAHRGELSRLELALRNVENTWLFLERGDVSLIAGSTDGAGSAEGPEVRMRIIEAQEAERARMAQEIHDGPAQALSNAIFQVEYVERVLDTDTRLARSELRFLRELLRRELGDIRSFITQLRPPILVELGLDGSIRDAAETMAALADIRVETELAAPADLLGDAEQTVVLRIVQEALQNVRKHAAAASAIVSSRVEDEAWVLEVRDDGRGFDVGSVAARGRRNFGLQFMRERAELIGATFDVRSRPDAGTVVRLAVPVTRKETR